MNKYQRKKEINRDRFIRWQDYRITQLSFSINIFLTFSIAALGLWVKLLTNEKFILPEDGKFDFSFSAYWICISIAFGIFSTITRLIDYRYTTIKIRKKLTGWQKKTIGLTVKHMGKLTWSFFGVQIFSFLLGIYFFLRSILIIYSDKLF